MFEVFDMNPYMKECAIADKEYEIGMMEATYMEMLLDNKLSLNKARAELKVMTESTKDYAVGDLVFLYKEAANETASQSEGIFTKIKNTLVSWFVKAWNAIQKVFTKRNTEAYETLMRSTKKYRVGWNPFAFLKHAEDAVSAVESLPDEIGSDINPDDVGKKILVGLGIGGAGIAGAIAITKAIKEHKEVEKPTDLTGQQGWTIFEGLTKCFEKLNVKIDKFKEKKEAKATSAQTPSQTPAQTQSGQQPNSPQNGENSPQGNNTPQNNPNQNNTGANDNKTKENGKKNPFRIIADFVMELGSKIRQRLSELGNIFHLNGTVSDVHEVGKKTNESDESSENKAPTADGTDGAEGDGADGAEGDEALKDGETPTKTPDSKKNEDEDNPSGKSEEDSGTSEKTPEEDSKKEENKEEEDSKKEENKEEEETPAQQSTSTKETEKPKRSEKWTDDTTMEIQLLNDYMNKYQKGYGSDTGLAKKAKNTKGLHPAAKEFERLLEKKDSTDEELDKAYKRFSDLCKTAGIRVLVNKDRTRWHFKESADELEVVEFTQDDLDLLRSL